jgi:hypothetical protein
MFFRFGSTLALTWMLGVVPAPASADFQEGQPFPVLVLPSLGDGDATSIAEFRGRKIALHVFASW